MISNLAEISREYHSLRLDANETVFFARELEFIKSRTYDIEYPAFKYATLIPISSEAGSGAETITYQQFDKAGLAKIIANYADDLPAADVRGIEFRQPIRSLGTHYHYSLQEIRAAQYAGRNLTIRQAEAARRAIEQKMNMIAWYGDSDSGLFGLLNHPNVTRIAVENDGTAGSTKFKDKTPDQIIRDMNDLVNGIVALTNGVETPNTLLMPIEQYTYISSTQKSNASDRTILQFFVENNPFVKNVDWINEAKAAGLGIDSVTAGSDVMVAYNRDPNKLSFELPQAFEQLPVQERNLTYYVNCHARVAGVLIYYPLSVAIAEGI